MVSCLKFSFALIALLSAFFLCIGPDSEVSQLPGKTIEDESQVVNQIIGDVSFSDRFGFAPLPSTNEDLRIRTHLEYVENQLRQNNNQNLSDELRLNRNLLLDLLNEYWNVGVFPRNYDYSDRRVPCFIDKNGRICAVGYLIERTAGREVAERINAKYKYESVLAMNDQLVLDWILGSGLTQAECAMIQPAYGGNVVYPSSSENGISTDYGIASAFLGGVNISLNTVNAIQISKGSANNTAATLGIVTGATSVIFGLLRLSTDGDNAYQGTNESERMLSMVNIGLGTSTVILSVWNIKANKNKKEKPTTIGLVNIPDMSGNQTIGLRLVKGL